MEFRTRAGIVTRVFIGQMMVWTVRILVAKWSQSDSELSELSLVFDGQYDRLEVANTFGRSKVTHHAKGDKVPSLIVEQSRASVRYPTSADIVPWYDAHCLQNADLHGDPFLWLEKLTSV